MNSAFLYRIFWWVLGLFSARMQFELLEWGTRKRIFADNVKTYDNLAISLWDSNLTTPIGVAAGLNFDEVTTDLLIQQGAGFGTLGSYTLNATPDHQQKLYYRAGKGFHSLSHYMAKRNIVAMDKKLTKRRHLPHFIGIDLTSFNDEEIHINAAEVAPGYLSEFEVMVQKVAPYCDYLVLDASTPMMPLYNLISDESSMMPLIQLVQKTVQVAAPINTPKIVLKVPFDMTSLEAKAISQIALKTEIDGLIVSGVSVLYKNPKWIKLKIRDYDPVSLLTGIDLKEEQIRLIRELRKRTNGYIPIISSGVAYTGQDAFDLMANGAQLVEVGSAFFVKGPATIQRMNAELSQILRKKGIRKISDVVGMEAPLDPTVEMRDLFD